MRVSPEDARIRRRLNTALSYKSGADVLGVRLEDTGLSATILEILAFEILLKAAILASGIHGQFSHNYYKAWQALGHDIQDELLKSAVERNAGHVDYSDIEKLLSAWEDGFKKGRYDYEINDDRDEAAITINGANWDGSPDTADFAFYPMELDGLIHALIERLEKRFL